MVEEYKPVVRARLERPTRDATTASFTSHGKGNMSDHLDTSTNPTSVTDPGLTDHVDGNRAAAAQQGDNHSSMSQHVVEMRHEHEGSASQSSELTMDSAAADSEPQTTDSTETQSIPTTTHASTGVPITIAAVLGRDEHSLYGRINNDQYDDILGLRKTTTPASDKE